MRHGGGVECRRDGEVLGAVEAELPEEVVDLRATPAAAADAEAGLRRELGAEVGRRGLVGGALVLPGVRRVPHRVDASQLRPWARPRPLRRLHGWEWDVLRRAVAAGLGLVWGAGQGRARRGTGARRNASARASGV